MELAGLERAYPKEPSGAMLQRVALARDSATHPEILLASEPLGALGAQTRSEMQETHLGVAATAELAVLKRRVIDLVRCREG